MNENRNNGCYKNLEAQINSIMKNTNEGSIKTRYRYLEAEKRCMEYTAEKWGLKKVQNFSSKHLVSYVSFMKEKGLSPAMIKTEIAGIRWFHRHSGSKNILIDNSKLDLQQREYGKVNRAWLPQEVKSAVAIGKYYGRMDFAFCVQFSYLYSTRISESCNLRINELEKCLTTSELKITGKGGRTRYVQMTTAEQKALIQEALNYAKEHNLMPFSVSSPNFGLAEQVNDPWTGDAKFADGCVTISGPENADAREWYKENSIPVFAYSSLARGFFSGAFSSSNPERAKEIMDEPGIIGYYSENNLERLKRCEEIAKEKGVSVAQIAMAWIYNQKFDVFALSSPVTYEQLNANISAMDIMLNENELKWLNLEAESR